LKKVYEIVRNINTVRVIKTAYVKCNFSLRCLAQKQGFTGKNSETDTLNQALDTSNHPSDRLNDPSDTSIDVYLYVRGRIFIRRWTYIYTWWDVYLYVGGRVRIRCRRI